MSKLDPRAFIERIVARWDTHGHIYCVRLKQTIIPNSNFIYEVIIKLFFGCKL